MNCYSVDELDRFFTSFFKKMGQSQPLFNLFSSFQTNITIFTTNICEKCPSSIQCCDSNPQPSRHESPPITTRPGLFTTSYLCVKWAIYRLVFNTDNRSCSDKNSLFLDSNTYPWSHTDGTVLPTVPVPTGKTLLVPFIVIRLRNHGALQQTKIRARIGPRGKLLCL